MLTNSVSKLTSIFLILSSLTGCDLFMSNQDIAMNYFRKNGCPSDFKVVTVPAGLTRLMVATTPPGLDIFVSNSYVGQSPIDRFVLSGMKTGVNARINGQWQNISGGLASFPSGGTVSFMNDFSQGFAPIKRNVSKPVIGSCILDSNLPSVPPGKTHLFVDSDRPGSNVYLNSYLIGQTPLDRMVNAAPDGRSVYLLISDQSVQSISLHSRGFQVQLLSGDTLALQEILP